MDEFSWFDKHKNEFVVSGIKKLKINPDMPILLCVTAMFQECLEQAELSKKDPETYLHITIPIAKLYKILGCSRKDKETLLKSLKRLSRIHLELFFRKPQKGTVGAMFINAFEAKYVEPDTRGTSGTLEFHFHRFFIPRVTGYVWRPMLLCLALKSETARLIFWNLAAYTTGAWKGTAKELYAMVNRIDEENEKIDLKSVREWKCKRLKPALKELEQQKFKIGWSKNIYGEEILAIEWPEAKEALAQDREVVETKTETYKE